MYKYLFPKIDKSNFVLNPRREGVAVDSTASPSNKGVKQNCLTPQGSYKFWPATSLLLLGIESIPSSSRLVSVPKFMLQLGKRGIYTSP